MEKVKITTINPGKSGTTNGKAWSKIGIQVEEKGDIWINGFTNKSTAEWTAGSIVNLELENDPKWGWQFKVPNVTDNFEARLDVLEKTVNALLKKEGMSFIPSAVVSNSPSPAANAVVDKMEGQPEPVPPPEDDDISF